MARTYVVDAELRGIEDYYSNTLPDSGTATILEDTLHNSGRDRDDDPLGGHHKYRVYIDDDHDASFNLELRSTDGADGDYTADTAHDTVSLASGQDEATLTYTAPFGLVRWRADLSGLGSAPTGGSLRVSIQAFP